MSPLTFSRRAALGLLASAATLPAALAQEGSGEVAAKGYATGQMAMGDPNAPLTVIEYASLTCPHCATFHEETWPKVKENYVDTGKVRFVFQEVYFDQYGLWASMVARCGGEGPFFGYIDTFLSKQEEWTRSEDIVGEIQRIGRLGGLSPERMQECLTDDAFMRQLVERYQQGAAEHGITSTPSFVIGGDVYTGAMGYERFSEILDQKLA